MTHRTWRTIRGFLAALGVSSGALLLGVGVWDGMLKDHFVPRRWAPVHEGKVYRSGRLSRRLVRETWRAHRIEVVVNLGRDAPGPGSGAAREAARALGIDRFSFPLDRDGTGDVDGYIGALAAVAEAGRAGRPVVIHCGAGVNRTGGVVGAYRMLFDGWSGAAAYAEMRSFGLARSSPLPGYLNENMERIVAGLIERGVLEAAPRPLPRIPTGG